MMIQTDLLVHYGATYKKVSAGEIIFLEGDTGHYYHQLVEGRVCWSNFNDDGKEILQELVWPGESFGELVLFDQMPYACSAVALTDCVILRLSATAFQQMLQDDASISRDFNKMFAEKLRFKLFLIRELAGNSPEHTVDKLFQYLQKHSNQVCHECNKLLLTRQQIANLTGMRVETIIRATKALENKGKLSIVKGKVFLTSENETSCCKSRQSIV